MRISFFGLGLSLFTLGFNIYIASWLARRLNPAPGARLIIIEAALLASAFYPAARSFSSSFRGGFPDAVLWLGYFILGASFIIFWVLLASDILLAAAKSLGARPAGLKSGAFASLALAILFVGLGLKGGLETPRLKRIEVPVKGLPAALDGFSILQISDLHLGRMVGIERLRKIAASAAAAKPDIIALTGDFAESREPVPAGVCEALKGMQARAAKVAVLGNHDMFTGGNPAAAFFEGCGFKVLRGEVYEPVPGLLAAGVDDLRRGGRGSAKILAAELDRTKPLVFLSHQPQGFDEITGAGSGVVLSGHTHKGQIFPFGPLEAGMFKYFYGLYRAGDYHVYVTAGAGNWGPPLRLFADAEVPLVILRSGPPFSGHSPFQN